MHLPSDTPRLPKWIFIAGDAALVGTAWFVGTHSEHAAEGVPLFVIVGCVVVGAVLGVYPFVVNHAIREAEALDNRQRALESLAATVAAAAEQVSIAATGLQGISEAAQDNFSKSERLSRQIQEKIAELDKRLADARREEAVATAKLETVASTIASSSEMASGAAAKLQGISEAAQDNFGKSERLSRQIQENIAELDRRLADARREEALAVERLDAVAKQVSGAAASLEAAASRVPVAPAAEPDPAAQAAPGSAAEAEIPEHETLVSDPADAPSPANPAATEEPAPEEAKPAPRKRSPRKPQPPQPEAEEAAGTPPASEPPPEPAAEIPAEVVVSAPALEPVPADPDPAPAAEPQPVAHPEPAMVADLPAPEPPVPAGEPALPLSLPLAVETAPETPKAAPRKRSPRKALAAPHAEAPEAAESPASQDEDPAPAEDLVLQAPAMETPEPAVSADGATRLIVTAYIGIGNRLFIRGEGPGLSWEKGVPLTFVSIGKWRWETSDAASTVKFRLYKNDQQECTALGLRVVEPGAQQELSAAF